MRFRVLVASFAAALSCLCASAAERFSIAQAMSSAFPTALTAAPVGGRVAWVLDEQGARNLWVAQPPDFQGHRLTAYHDDDGQEIAQLAWAPDGNSIVYVRGGDFEMGGLAPNPASLAAGVEQDVWTISVSGGTPRKLARGNSPAVSPDGRRVAYVDGGQVWWIPLNGNGKAEQLLHAKGTASDLKWSRDGKYLAFVSDRGDHSFIGVYEIGSRTVRYLDPSVDSDLFPVWSPDGHQIAFIRVAANTRAFAFGPEREGQPWSIRLADVGTGVGREIWRAKPGPGSVYHGLDSNEQLFWGAGDHIVFGWEGTGWLQLYSVTPQGQLARLTSGDFEVENVSIRPDRREVLFSSNQGDIDRRHLWHERVDGGTPEAITSGAGIEWTPVETSDAKAIAYLCSTATVPAHAAIRVNGGNEKALAPEAIPAGFPSSEMVAPQPVIISASDGLRIHGQIFLPKDAKPGERHPAVIFFHGGSRRQMVLGWHYMDYYHNAYAMNQYLASLGFIVLSVNYRSGIGYGLNFREALNYGAAGASEFNDVMGAGLYLRGRADVDPNRIGLWGGSYGGYLTAMGLSRASDLFAAGVDFHGVHDWNIEIHHFVPAYDPNADQNAARVAWESSPLSSVKTWRSPVLLIHGDDDRNVPFTETVRLVEALRKQHVEFQQLIFPDEIHGFLTHRRWVEAYEAAAEFLSAHLQR